VIGTTAGFDKARLKPDIAFRSAGASGVISTPCRAAISAAKCAFIGTTQAVQKTSKAATTVKTGRTDLIISLKILPPEALCRGTRQPPLAERKA